MSFRKLDLVQQLAHTLGAPWVAYFLFVAGLALMVLEFYTASVGIAGAVGALMLVGGCFGFSHLPVAPWAIGLLVLGMFGLAIDLQAGGLGPWTFIGGAALIAGSIWLYNGAGALKPTVVDPGLGVRRNPVVRALGHDCHGAQPVFDSHDRSGGVDR